MRSPERGSQWMPVPGALGGLHLKSGPQQRRGTHPFSVNMRGGVVRPGSWGLTLTSSFEPFANGAAFYQTPGGDYYTVVIGKTTGATPNVRVLVYSGKHIVHTHDFDAGDVVCGDQMGVMDWSAIDKHVVYCGAPVDGRVILVTFEEDGEIEVGFARSIDRSQGGNEFDTTDDEGPYRQAVPRAVACTVHQQRLVLATDEGQVVWSNINDPNAYAVNSIVRTTGGQGFDQLTAVVGANEGTLVIGQRDQLWRGSGELTATEGGFALDLVAHGIGIVGPATVQVTGSGRVLFLSERGPMMWLAGAEIPMGGLELTIGGEGSIYPLFNDEMVDVDVEELERYRPPDAALPSAVSRWLTKEQVYELAFGAYVDDGDELEDRKVRVRYDFRSNQWSLEKHPVTTSIVAVDDGRDNEVAMRWDRSGTLFIENIGDSDEYTDTVKGSIETGQAIESELQMPFVMASPARGKVFAFIGRFLNLWDATLTVSVNHSSVPSWDEQSQTLELAETGRDDWAVIDGFRFGTDRLSSETAQQERVGVPPLASGQEIRVRLVGDGKRWGLREAFMDVGQENRR